VVARLQLLLGFNSSAPFWIVKKFWVPLATSPTSGASAISPLDANKVCLTEFAVVPNQRAGTADIGCGTVDISLGNADGFSGCGS